MKLVKTRKQKRPKAATRGTCAAPHCRRLRRKQRRFCCTCLSRQADQRNPAKRCYRNLRAHAMERGKEFTISYEYFLKFALKYDYINRRGKHAEGFVIDRRDSLKGYIPGNLQCLTNRENVIKQNTVDRIRNRRQMHVDAKIMGHDIEKQKASAHDRINNDN